MSTFYQYKKSIFGFVALLVAGGYCLYDAYSTQGVGTLAQSPLNVDTQVTPAFIMAVDGSGSMSYHNQFDNDNGFACWQNLSSGSDVASGFFSSAAVMRTEENASGGCSYAYAYTGTRGNSYYGIPPLDIFGFARSSDFNAAYFNPEVDYQPWVDYTGADYPDASLTSTLMDPRDSSSGINLTQMYSDTRTESRFTVMENITLPEGTKYYVSGSCGTLQSGGWKTVSSGGLKTTRSCNIWISYWPATFYLRSDNIPAGYESVERTQIQNACGPGCNLWRYRIKSSDTAALQNFANWYSYYGNRTQAMIAGMTRSFKDINNMYVSYFAIGDHKSWDNPLGSESERLPVYSMASSSGRKSLYDSMLSLKANTNTPNRQAVYAAGMQFKRVDNDAPIKSSCQKNAIMLFTDGFSNEGTVSGLGNIDGAMTAPFYDGHSNTMADITMSYYANTSRGESPLRTDLETGSVPVPSECPSNDPSIDCNANLHANFYGITLGARGNLYDPDKDQDPYTDASIYSKWPKAEDSVRSTVDDIWHATVNARGRYENARTPADIAQAMRDILSEVEDGDVTSGSVAITGARISSNSLAVTPYYKATNHQTDWYGQLYAQKVTAANNGDVVYTDVWEASSVIPAAASRNIYYGTGVGAVVFDSNTVSLDMLCSNVANSMSLCDSDKITNKLSVDAGQAVSYLRGDQSLEDSTSTPLRSRTTVLGDIVNSTPVISSPYDDYGYSSLSEASSGKKDVADYSRYLETKSQYKSVVYVGANDGMLHAFDGESGVEKFAFIPKSVLGHMGNLLFPYVASLETQQDFQHRYYVDGPIAVSDVNYSNGNWATVLVGTTGAGGKGAYALDVTQGGGASSFTYLWEISDTNSNSDVADYIGHVLGEPVIVPVRNSSGSVGWKAIFGNGYGSSSGKAALFVVDIKTGSATLLPAVESTVAEQNGLGNIVVADRWGGEDLTESSRDGYSDTVYAADQNGAVWKFDLRTLNTDPVNNTVTTPLFVAKDASGNRQPITGGLELSSGTSGGVMVYFGTGSFSFDGDATDKSLQTFYGVLDDSSGAVTKTLGRADLTQQTILETSNGTRTVSSNAMGAGKKGWYLDLTNSGERFVGYPEVADGIVYFTTYQPSESVSCGGNGVNWFYGLRSLTGAAGLSGLYLTKSSASALSGNVGAVSRATAGTAPIKNISLFSMGRTTEGGDGKCWLVLGAAGTTTMHMERACGRQSWRQIR